MSLKAQISLVVMGDDLDLSSFLFLLPLLFSICVYPAAYFVGQHKGDIIYMPSCWRELRNILVTFTFFILPPLLKLLFRKRVITHCLTKSKRNFLPYEQWCFLRKHTRFWSLNKQATLEQLPNLHFQEQVYALALGERQEHMHLSILAELGPRN